MRSIDNAFNNEIDPEEDHLRPGHNHGSGADPGNRNNRLYDISSQSFG